MPWRTEQSLWIGFSRPIKVKGLAICTREPVHVLKGGVNVLYYEKVVDNNVIN